MHENWDQHLAQHFPNRHHADDEQAWAKLKQRLLTGQTVSGTVIAKAPFGAWLDIGVGFPALIEIVCITGMTGERYRSDEWCPIGSHISAKVGGFDDRNHQVAVWQVMPGETGKEEHSEEREGQ